MVVAEAEEPGTPADLPGIITQGPDDGRPRQGLSRAYGVPDQVLAYAPVAQMEGLRSAAHDRQAPPAVARVSAANAVTIVPARLDGSNFGSLTGGTDIADLASATIFGPTLAGLRSAARVETAALSDHVAGDTLAHFGRTATAFPSDRFGGAIASSPAQPMTLVENKSGD